MVKQQPQAFRSQAEPFSDFKLAVKKGKNEQKVLCY